MFNRIFNSGDKQNGDDVDGQSDDVVEIPVADIHANRFQPRTIFNEERIQELSQTIHTHGMIQPIIVRKTEENMYELIAGERRWLAVQQLSWEMIPAIIRDMTDTEIASVALIENLQREELTVIEEAQAYSQLIDLHSLTQEALAQRLGKNQSTIANKLRLLKLPEDVQTAVLNKDITERHARALIKLDDPESQSKVLQIIMDKDLNVKDTEAHIVKMQQKEKEDDKPKKKSKLKGVNKDMRIAMNTIRQSLTMVSDTGVDVESDEEDLEDYYQITIRIPKNK